MVGDMLLAGLKIIVWLVCAACVLGALRICLLGLTWVVRLAQTALGV
jgi:hypothetical protein